MRDLKREHNYSIEEQEGMIPFERDLLLDMIRSETLKSADRPEQGWARYADEIGATKKSGYQKDFKVLDY